MKDRVDGVCRYRQDTEIFRYKDIYNAKKENNPMRGMEGYMKGVNLGGWLSQFDAPTKEHFDTFITEEDIRRIAGMGLDHVRVPVDYTVIETEDGVPKEE